MDIKIIADSLSDIPAKIAAGFDIEVVPLTIIFDEKEYLDSVDINQAQMYEKIEECGKLPTTSQVSPQRFEEVFKKHLDMGKTLVYIASSSRATGTFDSAQIAKNNMGSEDIHLVDTGLLSYASGMVVVEAAKMAENKKPIENIIEAVEEMKNKVGCVFTVDTLEYLKRGGRLSATKAAIGTILNVKPILTLEDGMVKHVKSIRGTKKAIDEMIEMMICEAGENPENLVISHGSDKGLFEKLNKELSKKIDVSKALKTEVGAIIGIHTGPSVAVLFYTKK